MTMIPKRIEDENIVMEFCTVIRFTRVGHNYSKVNN